MISGLSVGNEKFHSMLWSSLLCFFSLQFIEFSLGVWIIETTRSATAFSLLGAAAILPQIFIAPLLGGFVDRYDRKTIVFTCQSAVFFVSLVEFVLFTAGLIDASLIIFFAFVNFALMSVIIQAFVASVSLLVEENELGPATGQYQIGMAFSQIIAPALGGLWCSSLPASEILLPGMVLMIVAIYLCSKIDGSLRVDDCLSPEQAVADAGMIGSLRFIFSKPILVFLLATTTMAGAIFGLVSVLLPPLVLSFSDAKTLGYTLSVAGVGYLVGSALVSTGRLGRPDGKSITAALWVLSLALLLSPLRHSVPVLILAAFLIMLACGVILCASQIIWQLQVPRGIQGRIFAVKNMLTRIPSLLAYLAAGPLADNVFEPAMKDGAMRLPFLCNIFGTENGAGIALMLFLLGVFGVITAGWAYSHWIIGISPVYEAYASDISGRFGRS